jgi:hypothetical protein
VPITVDVDDFVRAETHRMFAGLVAEGGGMNRLPGTSGNQPRSTGRRSSG